MSGGARDVLMGGNMPQPVGNTYRGIGADWFNARNIAAEDWQRTEQSAELAHRRNLEQLGIQNEFNAAEAEKARAFSSSEAQKQRDYETEMSNTAYQRVMADMKIAGLNPVLAFQQGGASTPSGSAAQSSQASSGSGGSSSGQNYRGRSADTAGFVQAISAVISATAGLVSKIPTKKGKIGF